MALLLILCKSRQASSYHYSFVMRVANKETVSKSCENVIAGFKIDSNFLWGIVCSLFASQLDEQLKYYNIQHLNVKFVNWNL